MLEPSEWCVGQSALSQSLLNLYGIVFENGVSMNSLQAFSALYCAGLSWRLHCDHHHFLQYRATRLARPALGSGELDDRSFSRLTLALRVSLFLLGVQLLPLVMGAVSAGLSVIYLRNVRDHPWLRRKANHIPVTLILLGAALGAHPSGGRLIMLPFQLLTVQAYFSAGLQKLRRSGLRWADGETLQTHLWEHWLWSRCKESARLAATPALCALLSGLTLAWELTFPICLFSWKLAVVYLVGGYLFHLAVHRLLGINYIRYFGLTYLSFAPWIWRGFAA